MDQSQPDYQLRTPSAAQRLLADRVREARLAVGFKQSTLAARAGVSLPTLRRFEQKGEISLKCLLLVCHALARLNDFDGLLRPAGATTMAELESRMARPKRKRGSR